VIYAGADLARVEARVGRKLTAAERHVDVEAIDALLNTAKDDLDAAITAEQRRVARLFADGKHGRIEATKAMLAVLDRLRSEGKAHAQAELASMGYTVKKTRRHSAADDLELRLRARLFHLTVKVQQAELGLDLSTIAQDAIERALVKVLGARSIAADLVAPAFDAGLGETFEEHADLVEGWEYSAVLDAGTCDPCGEHDGEQFDSWDAIQEVLPGGGPNPDCDGGDRCRCRPTIA
jgi:hypothetical protein